MTGKGHFGHRLVFGPEGYLWISSGERQKFDPSQDMESNLGKMVRLTRMALNLLTIHFQEVLFKPNMVTRP